MTLRAAVESSDRARFEALMLPHMDAAYTLARYWTRNEQDAEDIVQAVSYTHLTLPTTERV